DMSILELLQNYHQSSYVIEHFWEPIALAAMSTAISKASAQIFCNVLRQVFAANASHSNWYLPTVDLTTLLPTAIAQYVQNFDNQIICNQSIKQIEFVNGKARVLSNANAWTADHVVLATPPWQTEKILQAHATLQPLCTNLQAFNFESITTIYYKFSQAVQLPYPILSTLHSTCQWIFDRAFAAQPNILSAVITGPAAHAYDANHVLSDIVLKEISLHFPALSDPIAYKVIREKRAAFSCDVTIQQHRPRPATAYKNLWLCGDYLQTGLPATLEGALLSGKQTCSELLKTC
ncbi:MAG TPA: FAD-dependent oxidoreductase, partial [Gammaproteobacteria bacterium]|nr:FAD-dependent oxidoreductase [Gammaproteobacteria bacterium]